MPKTKVKSIYRNIKYTAPNKVTITMSDIKQRWSGMPGNKKTLPKDRKNNRPIKTYQELTKLFEFTENDIRALIVTVFYMFRKLSGDRNDIKKTQSKFWEMKIIVSEMKNRLDWIISDLDMAEEKMSELEDNRNRNDLKWKREKRITKMKKAWVSCRMPAGSLIKVPLKFLTGWGGQKKYLKRRKFFQIWGKAVNLQTQET